MQLDDAYANSAHIPDGESYYARWEAAADAFRVRHPLSELDVPYGAQKRQTFDVFHPDRLAKGTVVFVHGGYWKAGSPAMFSHVAQGAVDAGYSVAMLGYSLAPDARIGAITQEVAAGLTAIAARTSGPLHLVGHSAGGHLVARMGCADVVDRFGADWIGRVARIMPISPLGDLAPLMQTSMNADLQLDEDEVTTESPVRHDAPKVPVHVWVGGAERPAFLDQAQRLAATWGCDITIDPERHHFDVIEGLEDARSPLLTALFS
ncbi:alpha/beta hydrolase [Pseudooctadecabacter jejudonensis]|uniref:Alpha/beta hydrolase fold protein n=1 Tax=Pseudooctadecabacter jejudonensis TaxID=1391910 RepID=A0A1Y5T8K0_9RHOB|nr:alpha/beta hydrolase [Pseudooctadecabacter jejudonensis]SLN56221.1 alpha/beta hydrolase fold protein [Pseudooctadecabacter jejudonensis]